jgi:hypothetical protein
VIDRHIERDFERAARAGRFSEEEPAFDRAEESESQLTWIG